jgi:hypothetical protein
MSYICARITDYSLSEQLFLIEFHNAYPPSNESHIATRVLTLNDAGFLGQGTLRVIETFTQDMIDVSAQFFDDADQWARIVADPSYIVGSTTEIDD